MNTVEKLATAPVAKFARPWQFGPTSRIPAARAAASMRSCSARPAAPISPKPEDITTQTLTPRAAQAATAPTASSPETATIASSGARGSEATSG